MMLDVIEELIVSVFEELFPNTVLFPTTVRLPPMYALPETASDPEEVVAIPTPSPPVK